MVRDYVVRFWKRQRENGKEKKELQKLLENNIITSEEYKDIIKIDTE